MFIRSTKRKKNGKVHRYFSVVENRRLADGQTTQRQVMYLGEINDSQEAAWRRTLRVFDEDRRQYCEMSLFPDDRPLPGDAADAVSVKLTEMELRRPRSFGDCWLGCLIWEELQLGQFWETRLNRGREAVPWVKVLQLLVVNRLIDPGSEFRVHRQWFLRSAMDELLDVDFAVAGKDRLYRCLDRLLKHKEAMCQFLAERWRTLFDTRFDVLLYDLTSTYFEGECEQIPKAKYGYNRDGKRGRQVVIALVVTPDGLPLAYEVMAGNTSDKATLRGFLAKIESLYGKARRTWVMDRGIPSEEVLKEMRETDTQYLVGTPRGALDKLEKELADKPWVQLHEGMRARVVKKKDGETYVQVYSVERNMKEAAIRRRKFKRYVRGLHKLRRRSRKQAESSRRTEGADKAEGAGASVGRVAEATVVRGITSTEGFAVAEDINGAEDEGIESVKPATGVKGKKRRTGKGKRKSKGKAPKAPSGGKKLTRDDLVGALAVLKKEAGRVAGLVTITVPAEGSAATPENFHYELNRKKFDRAVAREGSTLLRTNLPEADPATLWSMYIRLTWIEAAFKTLKSDLAIRPIYHHVGGRVEAHILVAFLGYCLMAALRKKLEVHAPGLSPKAVLEQLATIQMVDVCLPTTDGRWLVLPRYTEPDAPQEALLKKLKLELPKQPPPRLRGRHLMLPELD
jgi:transposase